MSQDITATITATIMPNSSLCFNISMWQNLSDFAGKIWCGTQQSAFCGRFREEHPIGEARSEMLRFFCNTHRRIVASYLHVSPRVPLLSVGQSKTVSLQHVKQKSDGFPAFTDGFPRPLGVCAVHLPEGLTEAAWSHSLEMYRAHQNTA